jgi:hypothetical protein
MNCCVPPTLIDTEPGDIETEVTTALLLVTDSEVEPFTPANVAVIVVLPAATAAASPGVA